MGARYSEKSQERNFSERRPPYTYAILTAFGAYGIDWKMRRISILYMYVRMCVRWVANSWDSAFRFSQRTLSDADGYKATTSQSTAVTLAKD